MKPLPLPLPYRYRSKSTTVTVTTFNNFNPTVTAVIGNYRYYRLQNTATVTVTLKIMLSLPFFRPVLFPAKYSSSFVHNPGLYTYVTAYRERDLSVFEVTFFENSLKINLSSKNYKNESEVASIYELQFGPVIIIFRTKIDF